MVIIMIIIGIISIFTYGFSFQHIIGIFFPAIVLLIFSNKRHIGFGDIKLTIAVGFYYGYWQAGVILICALLLLSCYGLLLKLRQRTDIKTAPFAPFIAVFCLIGSILKMTAL
jgi:hypothetical protein